MTLPDFDPRDPATRADPYPQFQALRAEEPVHWSNALRAWVLTRYDDVKWALNDAEAFSADRITPFRDSLSDDARERIPDLLRDMGNWMVFTDPPKHTRLRNLAAKIFLQRIVDSLEPRVQAIVDRLLVRVTDRGEMDMIRDLGFPLPVLVIAHLLGVSEDAYEDFKEWSDDLATFVGSAQVTPDKRERAQAAIRAIDDHLREVIAARRREPQNDIISELIAQSEKGGWTDDELLATCSLLLFAGHETTTNLIGNGSLALLRHPEQLARLAAQPGLMEQAVEEMLRFDGPAPAMTRIARRDLDLRGRTVREGDRVFCMLGAASRDPEMFEEPERLDIGRWPNRHLAFGYGTHFCLGAPLARLEGRIAFRAILDRCPGLTLAESDPEWVDSLSLRGLKALRVHFEPAPRQAQSA